MPVFILLHPVRRVRACLGTLVGHWGAAALRSFCRKSPTAAMRQGWAARPPPARQKTSSNRSSLRRAYAARRFYVRRAAPEGGGPHRHRSSEVLRRHPKGPTPPSRRCLRLRSAHQGPHCRRARGHLTQRSQAAIEQPVPPHPLRGRLGVQFGHARNGWWPARFPLQDVTVGTRGAQP